MNAAARDEPLPPDRVGVVVVDHGSLRDESNALLLEVVALFERLTEWRIVEPAHMELAEPSIATAFGRCVARGAELVIVHPYFLLPGRHWDRDIPALTAEAAAAHRGVRWLVTAPLGLDERMARLIDDRVRDCLAHARGERAACPLCAGTDRCRLRGGE